MEKKMWISSRNSKHKITDQLASMVAAYLPSEIVGDILVRLPAKSLARLQFVCKSWRATISSPQFVKAHLDRVDYNNNFNVVCYRKGLRSLSLISAAFVRDHHHREEEVVVVKKLDDPLKDHQNPSVHVELLGSCNGLLLLCTYDESILWNPCTGEHNVISTNQLFKPRSSLVYDHLISGLGYDDSSSSEYKGIMVFRTSPLGFPPDIVKSEEIAVSICTSKTRTWGNVKYLSDLPYTISGTYSQTAVTVNGSPHWVVHRIPDPDDWPDDYYPYPNNKAIIYFDFAEEGFKEVHCPDSFTVFSNFYLGVLGDSKTLCVVDEYYKEGVHEFHCWVMKEYGVQQSWTMLFRFSLPDSRLTPLAFQKNGEALILWGAKVLLSYNLMTGHGREEKQPIFSFSCFTTVATYVESLASPYGFFFEKKAQGK